MLDQLTLLTFDYVPISLEVGNIVLDDVGLKPTWLLLSARFVVICFRTDCAERK